MTMMPASGFLPYLFRVDKGFMFGLKAIPLFQVRRKAPRLLCVLLISFPVVCNPGGSTVSEFGGKHDTMVPRSLTVPFREARQYAGMSFE